VVPDIETEVPCRSAKAERSLTLQLTMPGGGAKNWCWTYNRSDDVDDDEWAQMIERIDSLADLDAVLYLVFQQESGSEGHRDHLQGYVQLNRRCSLVAVKRDVFCGAEVHLTVARGTPQQNRTYCTKDEGRISGPFEHGTMVSQGHRTDLDTAAELVRAHGSARVAEELPSVYIRYHRGLQALDVQLQRAKSDALRSEVHCAVLWGPTGVGKSHVAFTLDEPAETFVVPIQNSGNLWFDGYQGQRTIVFDDFDPKTVPYRTLLRICDRYRLELPVKGGFVVGKWSNVIFTANDPPVQWYQEEEPYEGGPLERRLGLVLPVFDRNSTGLFRAAFTTTFYDEIAFDDQTATHGPEVDPEVAGNSVAATSGPVAESDGILWHEDKRARETAEDAVNTVLDHPIEGMEDEWLSLEAELAALEPESDLTEPFGEFDSE